MGSVFIAYFLSAALQVQRPVVVPEDMIKKEVQYQALLKDLRCLVCQNQDLVDSNAPLAKDLRKQVFHLVQVGQSDSEIKAYLQARYGDFILFKPPLKGLTLLLWFGPFVFLLLGLVLLWRMAFRRNNGYE